MKILLISFEFPPETGFGGIGTYTWYQSRALAKLGHEVHVLAGASEPTPLRSVEVDGVQVHRFRSQSKLMRALIAFGDNSLSWTKKRFENAFYQPMISDWRNFESWQEAGSPSALQHANALYKTALSQYTQPPMDLAIRDQLADYVARRKAQGGVRD